MPGPTPKPQAVRQRRNRSTSSALLPAGGRQGPTPPLPPRGRRLWHEATVTWWQLIWESPMATEWLASDIPDLVRVAELQDAMNRVRVPEKLVKLMSEYRQQSQRFGLSPLDRRRLQWEIERGEDADERTAQRRTRRTPRPAPQPADDPRALLRSVK